MPGFRNKIIYGFNKGMNLFSPQLLQKVSNQKMILPFYHSISDKNMPHIKHLYYVKNVKSFIKDLDFLLKHYKPIDYNEFKEISSNTQKMDRPSFLLSFDDGLSEFYDVIAPILYKKGIPAICFLNSAFIDNKDLFYRYKASLLIEEIKNNPSLLQKLKQIPNNSTVSEKDILNINFQNKDQLNEIANTINFSFENYLTTKKPYLSTLQIQSLIQQGFHFGAHSIDHPEYQHLSLKDQIYQTKTSMDLIADQFSLDYRIFSFPFTDYGVPKEFFSQIQSERIADMTFGSAGQKKENFLNHFHRIPFEMADLSARKIHNAELFYYLLKIPFGKNTISRL